MPASSSHTPSQTLNTPAALASASGGQLHDTGSDDLSSPVHLSQSSSRPISRNPSPSVHPTARDSAPSKPAVGRNVAGRPSSERSLSEDDEGFADWIDDEDPEDMPSDLRPPFNRPNDGKSQQPLLGPAKGENGYSTSPHSRPDAAMRRRSTFRSKDPDAEAKKAMRKRYTYAAIFLVISLISFTIQTETAVYIKNNLGWQKSYAMLYFTHGSWSVLWFVQLLILRIQKWNMPWATFWRRHVQILTQTAQMVQHGDVLAPAKHHTSPWPYFLKTIAFITTFLTVAGGSWYVAVSMTTSSDLTAIYNCSAFFAYAFSIPLLKEKLRWSKVFAVVVAIVGVLVVAYGDTGSDDDKNKSGDGTGGSSGESGHKSGNGGDDRSLGNLIIGVGSILYGLYEVLYKKLACPPEETSPGRSMIFANFCGSCIGLFTLLVLWIPLPLLHMQGLEIWEWPPPQARSMLLLSVSMNAIFSGSFLVLISLTSPVLSSVAALLTIFLVALVTELLPEPLHNDLSKAAWVGGALIIGAFIVLSWATYREMQEESRKKANEELVEDSDAD